MKPYSEMSRHTSLLLVFLTQPGAPLSKWVSWSEWLASTSLFSTLQSISSRDLLLVIREELRLMLEPFQFKHPHSPVTRLKIAKVLATAKNCSPWIKKTLSYPEESIHFLTGNEPTLHKYFKALLWEMNERASAAFQEARTRYWGLYSMIRIRIAGTKVPPNWVIDQVMKALVEADSFSGAIPFISEDCLHIRRDVDITSRTVGKWLRRYLRYRTSLGHSHRARSGRRTG